MQDADAEDINDICKELNLAASDRIKFKKLVRNISQGNKSLVNGNYVINPPKSYLHGIVYDYDIKMILIGASGGGKTAIMNRIVANSFNPDLESTIGIDYNVISMITSANENVKIALWDTGGQERFRSIPRQYYKNIDCAIIVFDLTDQGSFKEVTEFWLDEIDEYGTENIVHKMLVGNKLDLANRIRVDRSMAYQTALDNKYGYCEVSAKTGSNIKSMIVTAASQTILLKQKMEVEKWKNQVTEAQKDANAMRQEASLQQRQANQLRQQQRAIRLDLQRTQERLRNNTQNNRDSKNCSC